MFAFNIVLIAFAAGLSGSMALPAADLTARKGSSTAPWCAGLSGTTYDSQSNFKLTVKYTEQPELNTNSTGVPLVLGPAGALSGASFKALTTLESWAHDDYPSINLVEGRLIPQGADTASLPVANLAVGEGEIVRFVKTSGIDPTNYPQMYCVQAASDATSHPVLAIHGDANSFALCKAGQYVDIVYKPTSGMRYDLESCAPVMVQLIDTQL